MKQEYCTCQMCGTETVFTDKGGRCETDMGWLCHNCIKICKANGEHLHFEDEQGED